MSKSVVEIGLRIWPFGPKVIKDSYGTGLFILV